jgi:hypothetical protein
VSRGRRGGGKPGTGLSGRTIKPTLGRLTAALERKLVRNVANLVQPAAYTLKQRATWSSEQAHRFLAVAAGDGR